MREHDIIRRYFAFAAGKDNNGVLLGVGDDAAVLAPPAAGELVVSTDTLNAGAHFFDDVAPDALAYKAAAVSLSDIAAMGGRALWLVVALTAPAGVGEKWFENFASGLRRSSEKYGYAIVGGDLTRGAKLSVTTTAIGVCATPPRARSMAQAGDDVWVSGVLGGAAHAVAARLRQLPAADNADDMRDSVARLHTPEPRLNVAQALAGDVHAMMDISDGLLATALSVSEQSAAHISIESTLLPAAASLSALPPADALRCQLVGGDEYELFFTAPPTAAAKITALSTDDVPLTRIGVVSAGAGVTVTQNGQALKLDDIRRAGYEHDFS